jgi:hypothetical protein
MRTTGILLTLFLAFTALSAPADDRARPASPPQNDAGTMAVPSPPADSPEVSNPEIIRPEPERNALNSPADAYRRYLSRDSQAETYCFKIRSYLMQRESPDSDSTHLVGYSTCHPASRVQLKTTEEVAKPAPAK